MKEKDVKLLWGRAGNRCSKCRVELSHDSKSGAGFVVGEHAHIVGEKESSPRGKSPLSDEERDSYHNRILLCPNDHTEVDKNIEDWPVERLHYLKSTHELWVQQTLADSADLRMVARRVALGSIIDAAVRLCRLECWKEWTTDVLSPDPHWQEDLPDDFDEFRQKVAVAIWPEDALELACATKVLSLKLHGAAQKFLEHAEYRGKKYLPDKFYKVPRPNPTYDEDVEEYKQWLRSGYDLIFDATRAANWFSDIVRQDINPSFLPNQVDSRLLMHRLGQRLMASWFPRTSVRRSKNSSDWRVHPLLPLVLVKTLERRTGPEAASSFGFSAFVGRDGALAVAQVEKRRCAVPAPDR